jgi:type IVB pilus formation R64 PilN family outer membrane protein
MSRQIAINVEIYSVTLTEGMDFNIAFGTALKRLTGFGANYSGLANAPAALNVSGAVAGGGALSVAILNPNTVGSVSDVFTALSGIGDTSKVAKFPLVTLNNRPVSRRVGEDISYVAQSTSSSPVSSGITTSVGGSTLVPGTVHQGFSVQMTPRLLDDGRILMQYSLSVIDVKEIKTFNSVCGDTTNESSSSLSSTCTQPGTTSVQSPDTINRIFVQQSVLKSGSTLIMGGAEEEDLQQNSQGVGNPYNYLLGGGVNSAKSHTMLIMAITPQVLDVPHSEND